MSTSIIIAMVLATLIPLVFLYGLYSMDMYGMGKFKFIFACFAWGCFAVYLALHINTPLMHYFFPSSEYSSSQAFANTSRYIAPIVEELLKGALLFYLVRQPKFTYFVDGAIYGFACGVGFAVVENYLFLLNSPDAAALGTAISRVLSTNLMHATATGLIGIALGLSRFEKGFIKYAHFIGGLVGAMILHAIFNYVTNNPALAKYLLPIAGAIGFTGLGAIAYTIKQGLEEQKQWIQEKLGMADGVSSREAKLVQNLEDIHEMLEPLREMFGEEKGDEIEKFVVMQGQLGIKRKTLDKLPDEKMKVAVQAEMDKIRDNMDEIRQKLGFQIMYAVRTIFPANEDAAMFGDLDERISSKPRTAGAPDMFSSLGKAMGSETKDAPAGGAFGKLGGSMGDKLKSATDKAATTADKTADAAKETAASTGGAFGKLGGSMGDKLKSATDKATTTADKAADAAKETAASTGGAFGKLGGSMGDKLKSATDKATTTADKTADAAKETAASAGGAFGKLGGSMGDKLKSATDKAATTADKAADAAKETAASTGGAFGKLGGSMGDKLKSATDKATTTADKAADAAKETAASTGGAFGKLGGSMGDKLKSATDKAASTVDKAADAAKETATAATEGAADLANDAEEKLSDAADDAKKSGGSLFDKLGD